MQFTFWESSRADQFDFVSRMREATWMYKYVIPDVVNECKASGMTDSDIRNLICGYDCPYNVPYRGPKYHFTNVGWNNDDPPTFYLMGVYPDLMTTSLRFGKRIPTIDPSIKIRWNGMCRRVLHPKDSAFKNYGGRGIRICDAWHPLNPNGMANYIDWVNDQLKAFPGTSYQVDRRDNDGDYSPANCRLVSSMLNTQNTRLTKLNFEIVAEIRTLLKDVPKELRHKEITKMATSYDCTPTALTYAVNGRNWTNVNEVAKPLEVTGGKTGADLVITDQIVIDARKRMRECPKEKRRELLTQIASEIGVAERSIVSHITGVYYTHLNEEHPPSPVGKSLTRDDVESHKQRWLEIKDKETLNAYCGRMQSELGIAHSALYGRLMATIPKEIWCTKK